MLHAAGLKGLLIFLVVAGILVPLFHRGRVSPVLGFLFAGAALGPFGLGRLAEAHPWLHYVTFDDPRSGEPLAELGIIFLLFLLGLELSLQRLWQLRRYVLGVGLIQVVGSALAIGLVLRFTGAKPPAGLILGACFALSSTAIVMQVLTEQRRSASPVGRVALSVLLFQDLMVVPILFVVGLLGAGAGAGAAVPRAPDLVSLIVPFAQAIGAVLAIMLAGRYLVGPLLRSAVRTGARELIMAITLLIVIGAAMATGAAGLSVALGAFLAGLLLSNSEFRHHIEADLEPFKGLLLGIFFITVGTSLDLGLLAAQFGWIALALIGLLGVKAAVLYGASRAFGVERAAAAELALLLAQAGEFAFVVVGLTRGSGLLDPALVNAAIAVAALSMMATPLLSLVGQRLAARLASRETAHKVPSEGLDHLHDHVVIGGFGRVGQTIARLLEQENVPYVALDLDGAMVSRQRAAGRAVFYGDAARAEILARAGGRQARAFVVTLDAAAAANRMVLSARELTRAAPIFARAKDPDHARQLMSLGAIEVMPEAVEASLQLGARLLEALDVSDEAVGRLLASARAAECEQVAAGPNVGRPEC